jgi:hypothetical protein
MSERDDRTLAAEMLAVKTVMAHVLGRLKQLDPVLADAIQGGFADAADDIRKTGGNSRKSVTKALAVVEALRGASKTDNRTRPSVANDNK